MPRRAGFTYIELMLVIVIIGILAALGLPRLKGSFTSSQLKAATRDVTGILRYARNCAVLRELPCEVHFAPEKDSYQLVLFTDKGERIDPTRRLGFREQNLEKMAIGPEALRPQQLPSRVHFAVIFTAAPLTDDTRLPRVVYYPDGSATPATIAVEDEKKRSFSVEIFRTTGMARINKGLPKEKPQTKTLYYGPNHKP